MISSRMIHQWNQWSLLFYFLLGRNWNFWKNRVQSLFKMVLIRILRMSPGATVLLDGWPLWPLFRLSTSILVYEATDSRSSAFLIDVFDVFLVHLVDKMEAIGRICLPCRSRLKLRGCLVYRCLRLSSCWSWGCEREYHLFFGLWLGIGTFILFHEKLDLE